MRIRLALYVLVSSLTILFVVTIGLAVVHFGLPIPIGIGVIVAACFGSMYWLLSGRRRLGPHAARRHGDVRDFNGHGDSRPAVEGGSLGTGAGNDAVAATPKISPSAGSAPMSPTPGQLAAVAAVWGEVCEGELSLPVRLASLDGSAAGMYYDLNGRAEALVIDPDDLPAEPRAVQRWVLAHELGHLVNDGRYWWRPVWSGLVSVQERFGWPLGVALGVVVGLAPAPVLVGVLAAIIVLAIVAAAVAAVSRREEYAADDYAARLVGALPITDADVWRFFERKTADQHLAGVNPWSTHPAPGRRIAALAAGVVDGTYPKR